MKKITTLILLAISAITNAQYFEGFEKGVPGTMIQTFYKGETTFIDFGLSALNVDAALSENNSAVFFNAMEINETSTSIQTPILNLSKTDSSLEFIYFQKFKTENYANELKLEFSNDNGVTWKEIAVYKETLTDSKKIHIDLAPFKPSNKSCIKFKCTQVDSSLGYPIIIDDINIGNDSNIKRDLINPNDAKNLSTEIVIYPNPSNGIFNFYSTQPINVLIIDANGRKVFGEIEIFNNTIVNLTQFSKGIYFAKINNATTQEIKKLIIQ